MEITGYDYVVYSQKSINEIEHNITKSIKSLWSRAIIDRNEDAESVWIFVAKNSNMYEDDTRGYELNEEEEGCFSLIANKMTFESNLFVCLDNNRKPTHEVRAIFNDFWMYTLVLPDKIENSHFCKSIYDFLINAILSNDIECDSSPLQYSVQHYL